MITHQEHLLTHTLDKRSAPDPNVGEVEAHPSVPLDTSEIIIPGYDTYIEGVEVQGQAEQEAPLTEKEMLDGFFDEYVAFANDPSPTYTYVIPKQHYYDTELRREYVRAEVAEQKLQDLERYVRVGFVQGDLAINPEIILGTGEAFTVDSLCEAYVTDAVIRAQVRFDENRADISTDSLPQHVTAEAFDANETPGFFDQIKQFGSRAIQSLNLHSGEVTLPKTRMLPTVQIETIEQK